MTPATIRAKQSELSLAIEFYKYIIEQGHTFWHCSAQDQEKGRPFYYLQIHRSVHMSTCSACYKLMELKNRIRVLQKQLGIPQWPLRWNINGNAAPVIATDSNPCNINYAYLHAS